MLLQNSFKTFRIPSRWYFWSALTENRQPCYFTLSFLCKLSSNMPFPFLYCLIYPQRIPVIFLSTFLLILFEKNSTWFYFSSQLSFELRSSAGPSLHSLDKLIFFSIYRLPQFLSFPYLTNNWSMSLLLMLILDVKGKLRSVSFCDWIELTLFLLLNLLYLIEIWLLFNFKFHSHWRRFFLRFVYRCL